MATEKTIIKGAIEDHLGRIIHPDTEADQVMTQNGKTVEEQLADLLAKFANYLPLTGGFVSGDLRMGRGIHTINNWGCFSAGTDGSVVIAENAYKHPSNNTFHYVATHATMGARGIVFRNGQPGVWYFDTGNIATTADAEFSPTLISITDKATKHFYGDLNDLTENTFIDGSNMTNAPGTDWYYVQHFAHSANPAGYGMQIAYAFYSPDIHLRYKTYGEWSNWETIMTPSNTPVQYYSTAAPTAADGKDGDVWDVYV